MAATEKLVDRTAPVARSEAFRRLADQHLAEAYRLALAIVHDAAEAEDATHDAFVTAWREWRTLRDVSKFEAWFDRIVVNTCRNRLRRQRWWLRRSVRDVSMELVSGGLEGLRAAEDREILARAISRLTADQRVVIALRFYRDLTVQQIADRIGVPTGTVKSRLHYALGALQLALEPTAEERAP
jgi:RNA polymerase sigma-70 factor (ECF subfamily)